MKKRSKGGLIFAGIIAAIVAAVAYGVVGGAFSPVDPPVSPASDLARVDSIYSTSPGNHLHGIGYANEELYIATHYGLFLLTADAELYKVGGSTDDFMGFSLNQRQASVLYSSGHPAGGGNFGVRKSTDGGLTWQTIFRNIGSGAVDFHSMAISYADPQVIVGSYAGRIYVTEDGGNTWAFAASSPPQGLCWGAPCLAMDTQDKRRIYAGTLDGLYMTDNLGEDWKRISTGTFAGVIVHPQDHSTLYAFASGQIVKSEDSGKTWDMLNSGISFGRNEFVFQFSFDVDNPTAMYAATTEQRIFKTEDAGKTWERVI